MDKETIEKLLNEALEHYNNGKYSEASKLWKDILAEDPSNKQAQEGVKMAELLSQQWVDEEATTVEAPHSDEPKAPKEEIPASMTSESKAEALVVEGEQLLQSGKYGEAIDRFSRAMVLDESDHRVQNLLKEARGLLDKEQQELEKKLNSAIEHFEKGDFEGSEKIFKEITSVNPRHNDALFYLEKIMKAKEELKNIQSINIEEREGKKHEGKAREEEPIKVAQQRRQRTAAPLNAIQHVEKPKKPLSTWLVLIFAPIVFIIAGFFLARYAINKFYLTPSDKSAETAQATKDDTKDSAQKDSAVQDAKTPALSAGALEKVSQSNLPESYSGAQVTDSLNKLINDGKNLLKAGKSIEAEKKFRSATILDPISIEAKKLLEETSTLANEERKYVDRKNEAIKYFNEGEFTEALRIFYRLPEEKKESVITRYIQNSWYNLGVSYIKAGNNIEAKNAFQEVLSINPSDSEAKKEKEMAEWYTSHKLDVAFVNHVENLKFRKLND